MTRWEGETSPGEQREAQYFWRYRLALYAPTSSNSPDYHMLSKARALISVDPIVVFDKGHQMFPGMLLEVRSAVNIHVNALIPGMCKMKSSTGY